MFKQCHQDFETQRADSLHDVAGFLHALFHSHFGQHLQKSSFRDGHKRTVWGFWQGLKTETLGEIL